MNGRAGHGAQAMRRTPARTGAWAALALAAALLLAWPCARADGAETIAEYRIKAAFLVKFLGFVEWPAAVFERPDAPFVIGVLGARTVGEELGHITPTQRVNGHPVQVRTLARGDAPAGLHMLFVARPESGQLAGLAAAVDRQPLLVVTETEAGLAAGGTINFLVLDDKVRFDISLPAAERAGLKISARLLAVAHAVLPNPS
jgi:hypothetical protein